MRNKLFLLCALTLIAISINSCTMKIDGNLVCLENSQYERDTLDTYGFQIPRIKQLYFYSDSYKNEFLDIRYNNGYIETHRIDEIKASHNSITYNISKKKTLYFDKKENSVLLMHNAWTEFRHTDYAKYHQPQLYTIKSVSTVNKQTYSSSPSYNDIMKYKSYGEAKGNVKYISSRLYYREEMFGTDSLISRSLYCTQYNRNGQLIYEYAEDNARYNQNTNDYGVLFSHSYEYDSKGNLISERRNNRKGTTVKINSINSYNKIQKTSFYDYSRSSSPIAYINYKYDNSHKLIESDYYEFWAYFSEYHLDKKIRYTSNGSNSTIYGIHYDGDGKERHKNVYDINYSLEEGRIDFGDYTDTYDRFNTYKHDYSTSAIRDCKVTVNGDNLVVSYKYPYGKITDPVYRRFVTDDIITYDSHFNPIKREVTTYDESKTDPISKDKYIILYKYDSQGNWIERHSILVSHIRNGREEDTPWKGFIEYRDIEYHNPNYEETNLHTDVKEYEKHIATLKNEHWIIRIDLLSNGLYRYASWKKKETSKKPDLVLITNEGEAIKPLGIDRGLTFTNNNFSYEITWQTYLPDFEDQSEDWTVVVKEDDKVVLTLED